MKKRILIFIAALLIVLPLVLTACTEAPFVPRQTLDERTLGCYNPMIKVTYARPWFDTMITTLSAKEWTMEDNNWTDSIRKDLGIKLELEWSISDSAQYFQKLAASIATGKLPDIINVHCAPDAYTYLKTLDDNDVLTDIWPSYEQYASDALRECYDMAGEEIFYPATFDGQIKALCSITGSENESWSFYWIRKDWLDNLGMSVPTTMQELIEVTKAFRDKDPDGDGIKNTYGFPYDGSFFVYGSAILNSYHAYYDQWIDDGNDNLVYGSVQPQVKECLSMLSELYNGDYLDKDMVNYETAMNTGRCGIWPGKVHNGLFLQPAVTRNNDADFVPIRLVSIDNEEALPQAEIPSYQYYVVNTKCDHPEVLVKLLNYYLYIGSLDSDNEYAKDMFTDADANELWQFSPVNVSKVGSNFTRAVNVAEALTAGNSDELKGADKDVYDWVMNYRNGDIASWAWEAIYGGEDSSEYLMGHYIENNMYNTNKFNGVKTDSMIAYDAQLKAGLYAGFNEIITGLQPIEYFDVLVKSWGDNGGNDITAEVNEWYSSVKG